MHKNMASSLQLSIGKKKNNCLSHAGRSGKWVQDWEFAQQYGSTSLSIKPGPYMWKRIKLFDPSLDAPLPWPSSWRWIDDLAECQVDVMTADDLCNILIHHNIDRVLFYGDSITGQMFQSFVNLVGNLISEQEITESKYPIHCYDENDNKGGKKTFHIFHGKDSGGNAFPDSPRGLFSVDNQTLEFLKTSSQRVLGIFNIGAHYHNRTHYYEDMDKMLNFLVEIGRTQDLYFFRSTSPGHDGCGPLDGNFNWSFGTRFTPYSSYDEYKSHLITPHKYSWDEFEYYNFYTEELLKKHNAYALKINVPRMHYLNIFNMTALRHDSHVAPADCLHFIPFPNGPVDWWNHFLFTHLKTLLGLKKGDETT